jgi:hypothetical protein
VDIFRKHHEQFVYIDYVSPNAGPAMEAQKLGADAPKNYPTFQPCGLIHVQSVGFF